MAGYTVERPRTTIVTNDGPKNIFGNSPFTSSGVVTGGGGGDSTDREELLKCMKTFRLEGVWNVRLRGRYFLKVNYDGVYSEECRCVRPNAMEGEYSSQGLCPKDTEQDGPCKGVDYSDTTYPNIPGVVVRGADEDEKCGTFCEQVTVDLGPCFEPQTCSCYKSVPWQFTQEYYYLESNFPDNSWTEGPFYTWDQALDDGHPPVFDNIRFLAESDQWGKLCDCKGGGWVPTF